MNYSSSDFFPKITPKQKQNVLIDTNCIVCKAVAELLLIKIYDKILKTIIKQVYLIFLCFIDEIKDIIKRIKNTNKKIN